MDGHAGQLLRRHRRTGLGASFFHSRRLQQRHLCRFENMSIGQRDPERADQLQYMSIREVAYLKAAGLPSCSGHRASMTRLPMRPQSSSRGAPKDDSTSPALGGICWMRTCCSLWPFAVRRRQAQWKRGSERAATGPESGPSMRSPDLREQGADRLRSRGVDLHM